MYRSRSSRPSHTSRLQVGLFKLYIRDLSRKLMALAVSALRTYALASGHNRSAVFTVVLLLGIVPFAVNAVRRFVRAPVAIR